MLQFSTETKTSGPKKDQNLVGEPKLVEMLSSWVKALHSMVECVGDHIVHLSLDDSAVWIEELSIASSLSAKRAFEYTPRHRRFG